MTDKPIHDRLFKHTFSNPKHAKGELERVLPASFAARIDWSSLKLEPGGFVEEALSERLSDLLFSVRLAEDTALLYLLFDHQSTVDPLMPFRQLRLIVRIWDRWLVENQSAQRLPAVIPIVLSNAAGGWSASTELLDVIDLGPEPRSAVVEHLPRFRFLLDDLGRATAEEIKQRRLLSAMARLTQGAFTALRAGDAVGFINDWLDVFRRVAGDPQGFHDLEAVVYYVVLQGDEQQRGVFLDFVQDHLGDSGRRVARTIADSLRAEGRVEGRVEGTARAVLAVFEARGVAVPENVRARILACTDAERLGQWIRRAAVLDDAGALFEP